jgi:hypothetical protein
MLGDVLLMIDQSVAQELLEVSADVSQSGNAIDDVSSQARDQTGERRSG